MLYNQLKKCIDEYTKIKHVCNVDDYGLQITVVILWKHPECIRSYKTWKYKITWVR